MKNKITSNIMLTTIFKSMAKLLKKPVTGFLTLFRRNLRFLILSLLAVPIAAYPLSLADYLNTSEVIASSDQYEQVLTNNTSFVQVTPNAELTIIKKIQNDNGGDLEVIDFSVISDAGTLVFDTGVTLGSLTSYTAEKLYVPPGSYSLEEIDVDGYAEGTWTCDTGTMGSTDFNSGVVTLGVGERAICEITNDDIAPQITLAKNISNDDGGALTIVDFELSIDGTIVGGGVATPVLANTNVTISELDLPGYTEGTWQCVDDNNLTTGLPATGAATGETLVLEPGSNVTCTISNDDIAPQLILSKNLINDHGGLLSIADFNLSVDGNGVTEDVATTVMANTDITISELNIPGYAQGNWQCVDNNGLTSGLPTAGAPTGAIVNILPGSVVQCNIENNDIEPQLQLSKLLINDNGGIKTVTDFGLSIDAAIITPETFYPAQANQTISISELDLDGYTEGTWLCTDQESITTDLPASGLATGTDLTLLPGSIVTCAITNNDEAPSLTLAKTVINDDGGDLLYDDFAVSIDSNLVADGIPNLVSSNSVITISELLKPGYIEGTWSCIDDTGLTPNLPTNGAADNTELTLVEGANVTCSIVNNDIAPTLTLTKAVINDNGGLLSDVDFDLSIDDSVITTGTANIVKANTLIKISELDLPGYTEGAWQCLDSAFLTTDLPSSGLATLTELSLKQGSVVTCSVVNNDIAPKLTLAKNLINDHGGNLTIPDFNIAIDGVVVDDSVSYDVQANTSIAISELLIPGYEAGTWSCTDGAGLTTGLPTAGDAAGTNLTVLPGSDVTCSIVNNDIEPTLTLAKQVINDDGGLLDILDFDISLDGSVVTDGVANNVLANTTLSISELDLSGYAEGTWSCTDANGIASSLPSAGGATGTTFQVPPGADVTCAITNDDIAPLLSLNKIVMNTNGGNNVVEDFDISIDAVEIDTGVKKTMTANTLVTISELDLPGYTEGTWQCTDAAGLSTLPSAGLATGVDFQLMPGSDVSCEITNTDVAPSLTLVKSIINLDGGLKEISDFEISIDGTVATSGLGEFVSANTAIQISELDLPGYTEGVWSCVDSTGLTQGLPTAGVATGTNIVLEEGADVTCSIENDDIAPQLTLVKNIINDDGGNLVESDFVLNIDGVQVTENAVNTVQANTTILVSEANDPGYIEGVWSCVDSTLLTSTLPTAGAFDNTEIVLLPGSEVTCSIENNDIAPRLTLTKTLVNDNGGDLTIADFNLAVDGVVTSNSLTQDVAANTLIEISELDLPGYTEGTWLCEDSNNQTIGLPMTGTATSTSFELKQGSDVLCSITNNDIAPELKLVKQLVNDDGGNLVIDDFDISIDDTEVATSVFIPVMANTDIKISELDMPGYTEGLWVCEDSENLSAALPIAGVATGEIFQVKQGSKVTCSIENNDVAPLLTLTKQVINDNGGDKVIADFEISVDGTIVTSGVATTVLANTDIVVSELDLVPYSEGTWECLDNNLLTNGLPAAGLATGTTIALAPGADVNCTIVNNDLGIDLSISKTVDDPTPNIGQTITFSLTVLNAGPDSATNVSVKDIVPAGFTYVLGSISGGDATDESDPEVNGLFWSITSMPANTPVVLTFDAVVNAP